MKCDAESGKRERERKRKGEKKENGIIKVNALPLDHNSITNEKQINKAHAYHIYTRRRSETNSNGLQICACKTVERTKKGGRGVGKGLT